MRWTRVLALFATLCCPAPTISAQAGTGRITGIVTETESGQAIADVNVSIVGTALGSHTDAEGRFAIASVAAGRYQLRFSRLGFAARTDSVVITAGGTTVHAAQLRRVSVTLDQVVVVGYGTQKRSDLTGSVASVTPHVEQTPITSLEQTLQGAAPGVIVSTASSAPGGGISIRIRGGSSMAGSNEPLYIIDGFPVENNPNSSSPTSGGRDSTVVAPANPLATINANDIASIEILKDASATSIYGARGANGVIIITTKRGAPGAPKVSLDTYTGQQTIAKRYDILNAKEFAQFANAWAQAQTTPTTPFGNVDSVGTGTNWQDQIFRSAPMSSVQLGLTGGTVGDNATRYAVSGGVLQQTGIVYGSDFKRMSLRGNLSQAIGSKLNIGSNLLVSRVSSASVPTDGSFNAGAGAVGAAIQYLPIMSVRRTDGAYTLVASDCPTVLTAIGISCGNIPNPVASAFDITDKLGDTRVLAGVTGDYALGRGFSFRTNIGADLSNRTRDTYYPRSTLQGASLNGRAIRGTLNSTSWLNEYTLNYQASIGDLHRFQAVAGYTRQQQDQVREQLNNSNFVSDVTGYESIGSGNQAGGPTLSSGTTRTALASYLGRINYTLADKYLFTVTSRRDGSSRFGADHRWGVFPSAALGWRVSEEPFMRRFTNIDQLKLRASYGVAGNPSIQPFQSLTHLSAGQYVFGTSIGPAYYPSTLGNADLKWESTKQADYGVDLSMYQDRISFTADYYSKRTDDLLLQIDLPSEAGFTSAFVNAGAIENKGLELGATVQVIRGDQKAGSFSWTTTMSYTKNRNKVLSLGGVDRLFASSVNSDIKAAGSLVQVGQPIGVFFGYQVDGIFRDSASLNAWKAVTTAASTPGLGNSRFVDVNGDGKIDANDRTIIGDPTPKFSLGWQNSVSYKGFQLSALLDGTYGGKIFNLNLYRLEGASPSGNVLRDRFEDAWSPTNPNGKYAKIGAGIGFLGSDFTSELIEDGSYSRLRTLTLAREIPQQWLRGMASTARLYVTGQNLITWTKYSGFNPDVSSLGIGNTNRGIDIGSYPLARTFTFGANLSY
ncbi:MAG: TonB-dependent outer membrane protein SusC/RagA [Gemmatimonadetes bacterium]|nr:TonB-dependent outer membrane protein SusC/RagA [Gemmatimonadota bacterium]